MHELRVAGRLLSRTFAVAWLSWMVFVLSCAGPSDSNQPVVRPSPAPVTSPDQGAPVHSGAVDLSSVVRNARFAFRDDGPGSFRARRASFSASVSAERITLVGSGEAHATIIVETLSSGRGTVTPLRRSAIAVAKDGHLLLDRGPTLEELRNVDEGLQQSFRFERRPAGTGDLEVRVRVAGAAFSGVTADGHEFIDAATGAIFRYGNATWIDARGRRTPIDVQHRGDGVLSVIVPESVLLDSEFPAEIDPILSLRKSANPSFVLGYGQSQQVRPAAAFDGTNYFVLWVDARSLEGYGGRVTGARVTPSGAVLDPGGIEIFGGSTAFGRSNPTVTFDGTNYMVVAVDSSGAIKARLVSPTGALVGGTISVGSTLSSVENASVAFGDGTYLVVWTTRVPGNVVGQRLDANGLKLGGQITIRSEPIVGANLPVVSFGGRQPIDGGDEGRFLVAWRIGSSTSTGSVEFKRVTPGGTILDSSPIVLATSGAQLPAVASSDASHAIVWHSSASGYVGVRVGADGTPLDSTPFKLSGPTTFGDGAPRVAQIGSDFAVAWRASSSALGHRVVTNRLTADGVVLDGTGIEVAGGLKLTTAPTIACSSSACLTAWADDRPGEEDIFAARVASGAALDLPSGFPVSVAASEHFTPSVAYGGGAYLVVWDDRRSDFDFDIYGARVSTSGEILDPAGIEIASATGDQRAPRVAASSSGWFVVWQDHRATTSPPVDYHDVYGARVGFDGTVKDAPGTGIRITNHNHANQPVVASDGTDYLVVWHVDSLPFINDAIQAARVDAAGAMLDPAPLTLTPAGESEYPSVTYGDGQYMVVWGSRTHGIRGTRIKSTGPMLDPAPGPAWGLDGWFPTVSTNGLGYTVAYRRYLSSGSSPHIFAARLGVDGAALDAPGQQLSTTPVTHWSEAYFRLAPEVTFDGVDTEVVWTEGYGNRLFAAWITRFGSVIWRGPLLSGTSTIANAAVAGQGDGNHSLIAYLHGDTSPGVRALRTYTNVITFKVKGASCSVADECKTGFCVDGVCCDDACGGGDANDCMACSAALSTGEDGVCSPAKSGAVCRAAAGVCDTAETCDGSSTACPANAFLPATTVCRAAVDTCDVPETCTGSSAACPADELAPPTTVCRASTGPCDPAETCTGTSTACPSDELAPATTICRPAAGACDVAESCTGTSGACPADTLASAGVVCRAAAGACDAEEVCSGSSADCPSDTSLPATTECRPAAGPCDVAETCTGTSAECPSDALLPPTTVCRAAAGACDVAEHCTGTATECPADAFAASTIECRPSAGPCDLSESCTGLSGDCPADAFAASTVVCRPSAGVCDPAETCSGTDAVCPTDVLEPATTVCHVATDACDTAIECTGTAPACPPSARVPGCCLADAECDDDDACTIDTCTSNECTHAAIAGCDAGGADAGSDASSGDTGDAWIDAADTMDVGVEADASLPVDSGADGAGEDAPDATTAPTAAPEQGGGCGCRVVPSSDDAASFVVAGVTASIGVARRRRRRRLAADS